MLVTLLGFAALSLLTGLYAGIGHIKEARWGSHQYLSPMPHMIFAGFVFSVIFAHAAVIIPSLSGKLIPYHPYFYAPLILLHCFLLVRVIGDMAVHCFLLVRVIGDMAALENVRMIRDHRNALTILLFQRINRSRIIVLG